MNLRARLLSGAGCLALAAGAVSVASPAGAAPTPSGDIVITKVAFTDLGDPDLCRLVVEWSDSTPSAMDRYQVDDGIPSGLSFVLTVTAAGHAEAPCWTDEGGPTGGVFDKVTYSGLLAPTTRQLTVFESDTGGTEADASAPHSVTVSPSTGPTLSINGEIRVGSPTVYKAGSSFTLTKTTGDFEAGSSLRSRVGVTRQGVTTSLADLPSLVDCFSVPAEAAGGSLRVSVSAWHAAEEGTSSVTIPRNHRWVRSLVTSAEYGADQLTTPVSCDGPAPLTPATPTLAGTVEVGSTVTAVPGPWTSGTTFAYQWNRAGIPIVGATAASYTPVPADLGTRLTVTVTGTDGSNTASRTSSPVTVAAGQLAGTTPKVTGKAKVGKKLKAKAGAWPIGTVLRYQWQVKAKPIKGATKAKLKLTKKLKGKKVYVVVTGTKPGYADAVRKSKPTRVR